jgi:DNA-binding response OmpR family regulator
MAKRVLVADDEPDIVESVKFSLGIEGIESLKAYDGEEALAKAKRERPDLIVLDVMMPKINGYKVARLLKFEDAYRHIPIIMLTARAQEKDKQTGQETGADKYITKPFEMDELVSTIKRYLEGRA